MDRPTATGGLGGLASGSIQTLPLTMIVKLSSSASAEEVTIPNSPYRGQPTLFFMCILSDFLSIGVSCYLYRSSKEVLQMLRSCTVHIGYIGGCAATDSLFSLLPSLPLPPVQSDGRSEIANWAISHRITYLHDFIEAHRFSLLLQRLAAPTAAAVLQWGLLKKTTS